MDSRLRAITTLLIWSLVLGAGLLGLFRPIDDTLRDLRFAAEARSPTGSIVFVDIDARSLDTIGVWPWPRSVHARVVDALMDADVGEIAFDVDFSAASTAAEDQAFEDALQRAGGYVQLAALRQFSDRSGEEHFNLPLPRFARHAEPVTVNVPVGTGGIVRTYPFGMTLGGMQYPSLASAITDVEGPVDRSFVIDYSIDPEAVDRISVADVLQGAFNPSRVAGRTVVIGASALELRDTFIVPHHGLLPGALVQILAAETLRQGRLLEPAGWIPVALLVGFLGLCTVLLGTRVSLPMMILGGLVLSVFAEGTALLLQARLRTH